MKLRNKLILSCAALAAVATTAVSTTYAWYTSNTEVSASGLTAKTDNNGADTLLISKTGAKGTWSSSINFTEAAATLSPVEYVAGASNAAGTYKSWVADSDSVGDTNSGNASTVKYTFWLKDQTAENNTAVYVKSLAASFFTNGGNASTALPTKDVLNTTGLGTYANGANYSGATYNVSLQRALDIEVAVQQVAGVANSDDENAPTPTNVSAGVYGFDNYSTITDTLSNSNGDYNAHQYYNAVKGLPIGTSGQTGYKPAIATTDPLENSLNQIGGDDATAAWTLLTAAPTAIYKVTVTIFLNGWDVACFDAVQGQTFTLDFKFATTDGTTVKVAAPDND